MRINKRLAAIPLALLMMGVMSPVYAQALDTKDNGGSKGNAGQQYKEQHRSANQPETARSGALASTANRNPEAANAGQSAHPPGSLPKGP